jgi:hypothetical protein
VAISLQHVSSDTQVKKEIDVTNVTNWEDPPLQGCWEWLGRLDHNRQNHPT